MVVAKEKKPVKTAEQAKSPRFTIFLVVIIAGLFSYIILESFSRDTRISILESKFAEVEELSSSAIKRSGESEKDFNSFKDDINSRINEFGNIISENVKSVSSATAAIEEIKANGNQKAPGKLPENLSSEMDAIKRYIDENYITLDDLKISFDKVYSEFSFKKEEAPKTEKDISDKLTDKLSKYVEVEKVADKNSDEALLSSAKSLLESGNVDEAVEKIKSSKTPTKEKFDIWLLQADKYGKRQETLREAINKITQAFSNISKKTEIEKTNN